ncbi:MAG: SDR family NAD(P)-dependent oxidoreductase, partial [Pseudonocardiales bacterium]|nr:SDR family NAD(P)-dependent oxidoreductase [Pseudonocardiales bacterium]
MGETVVILGGRSEIGLAVARRLAPGATVVLAARRSDHLTAEVAVLRDAGAASVDTVEFDADDLTAQRDVLEAIVGRY